MATTGRSTNVSLTPYMQRRGQQSRSKDPFCCAYCGSRTYFKAFATVYGNGSMVARSKRGLILKTGWSQTFRQSIVAQKCSPPKPRRAFWQICVVLLGVSTLAAADEIPTPVRDLGDCSRRVSLWHIPCLRHHPVEQAEIPCPHGEMGKLLPLQPLLKSHHHRAGLRTIRRALLLEGNSAPAYTWGAALFGGTSLRGDSGFFAGAFLPTLSALRAI
jgi:hypothetical protein